MRPIEIPTESTASEDADHLLGDDGPPNAPAPAAIPTPMPPAAPTPSAAAPKAPRGPPMPVVLPSQKAPHLISECLRLPTSLHSGGLALLQNSTVPSSTSRVVRLRHPWEPSCSSSS